MSSVYHRAWAPRYAASPSPGSLGAALVCVQVGLFLNALVPHLLLSLWSRRYTPGVATALLLNVPFTPYLLYRAFGTDLF